MVVWSVLVLAFGFVLFCSGFFCGFFLWVGGGGGGGGGGEGEYTGKPIKRRKDIF